ncbi:MAG: M23 family metallopeptidase [Luteimonas sp.]|jgi:murein DD-endopeptidase MepM/ murein hydrolase activator NlpD
MKSALLFLAGLLVGANLVYFAMRRPTAAPTAAATPVAADSPAAAPPTETAAAAPPGANAAEPARAAPANAPAPANPATTPAPADDGAAAGDTLLLPVQGVQPAQLHDTFAEARDGGARPHDALDIMAPRGTPVLAAVDGSVEKLFTSVPGGLTIYEFDRSRTRAYYYAHLDRYADGLAEGQALRRGDVIGYVGSTGNAAEDAPHLHFAIFVLGPDKHWWQGTAIDPYPLLVPAAARR